MAASGEGMSFPGAEQRDRGGRQTGKSLDGRAHRWHREQAMRKVLVTGHGWCTSEGGEGHDARDGRVQGQERRCDGAGCWQECYWSALPAPAGSGCLGKWPG